MKIRENEKTEHCQHFQRQKFGSKHRKDRQKSTFINLLSGPSSLHINVSGLVPNHKTVKTLLVTLPADIIHISLKIYNKLYHNFYDLSILIFIYGKILLCSHPIIPNSRLCPKRYTQRHRIFHFFANNLSVFRRKPFRRLKYQLIMNL